MMLEACCRRKFGVMSLHILCFGNVGAVTNHEKVSDCAKTVFELRHNCYLATQEGMLWELGSSRAGTIS